MNKRTRWLTLLLFLVAVTAGAYFVRWPLAGMLIQRLVLPPLGQELGVELEMEPCTGSLISNAQCPAIRGTAKDDCGSLRRIHLEGISLTYDLPALITGDFSALSIRVERASLLLELDRPGLPGESGPDKAVDLPDRMPVIDLAQADLLIKSNDSEVRLDGAAVLLHLPDDSDAQPGALSIREMQFTLGDQIRRYEQVEGLLAYSKNQLALDLLNQAEKREILKLDVRLTDSVPPRAQVDLAAFDGRAQAQAEIGLTKPHRFETRFHLEDLDLESMPLWVAMVAGAEPDLAGRLLLTGTAAGELTDVKNIQARFESVVDEGRFQELPTMRLRLHAGMESGRIVVERCDLQLGTSWVRITEGSLPLTSEGPDLSRLASRFAFDLHDSKQLLELAELDTEHLAGIKAEGRGRVEGWKLLLEEVRFDLNGDYVVVENGELLREGEGLRFTFKGLDARLRENELSLLNPAVIRATPERIVVDALDLKLGEGKVHIIGSLDQEKVASARLRLSGIVPNQLRSLLLMESLPGELDWTGLAGELDLEGTLDAPRAHGRFSVDRAAVQGFQMADFRLEARLLDTQVDLSSLAFNVPGGGTIEGRGGWTISHHEPFALPVSIKAAFQVKELDLEALHPFSGTLDGLAGTVTASMDVEGTLDEPRIAVRVGGTMNQPPIGLARYVVQDTWPLRFESEFTSAEGTLDVKRLDVKGGTVSLLATGALPVFIGFRDSEPQIDLMGQGPLHLETEVEGLDFSSLVQDEAVQGVVSAKALLKGTPAYPEGEFSAAIHRFFVEGYGPHLARVEGRLHQGLLVLDKAEVAGPSQPLLQGTLTLNLNGPKAGTLAVPGPGTRIERLNLDMENVDLSVYSSTVGLHVLEAIDPAGQGVDLTNSDRMTGSFHAQGGGALGAPEITMTLSLKNGLIPLTDERVESWRPGSGEVAVPFDVNAEVLVNDQGLVVKHLHVETPRGQVAGSGILHLLANWEWLLNGAPLPPDTPVTGAVRFDEYDLAGLGGALPEIRSMTGNVTGELTMDGTLAKPGLSSNLTVRDARLRLEMRLPTLEITEARLEADATGVRITEMKGSMGGGPVTAEGGLVCENFEPCAMDLKIFGEHVLLYRAKGIKVRSNVDLAVTGPIEGATVSGDLLVSEAAYVQQIPLIAGKGPPSVDDRIRPLPRLPPPYLSGLTFNVRARTAQGGEVRVDNNLLKGNVRMDMGIKGTGKVSNFEGSATFDGMLIKLPTGIKFQVETGRLTFTESDPFMPRINLNARARRYGYELDLIVQGPINDMGFMFSSNPPLDNDAIRVLLTTGALPQQLVDRGLETQAVMQVGSYLGEELLNTVMGGRSTEEGESLADRLELIWGHEISPDGVENILIEFHIDGPWYIQAERDIYSDMNLGGLYRIRFK